MAKRRGEGPTAAEVAELVTGYERSGLTRRAYCAELGIPVTTFDYYRRRHQPSRPALWPVEIIGRPQPRTSQFAIVLTNGRRIEAEWGCRNEDLQAVVRAVEQA